jgi:hypothetical protein
LANPLSYTMYDIHNTLKSSFEDATCMSGVTFHSSAMLAATYVEHAYIADVFFVQKSEWLDFDVCSFYIICLEKLNNVFVE